MFWIKTTCACECEWDSERGEREKKREWEEQSIFMHRDTGKPKSHHTKK